jgi:hypothetical protein
MMLIARIFGVAMLATTLIGVEVVRAEPSEEIVLVHELRTAFYEHAPKSLARAMSSAVVAWCSAGRSEPIERALSWLCRGQKLVYFRSVYVSGGKGPHGLVCEDNGTSSLKYFGMDLVADVIDDRSCVPAEFDGSRYKLYVAEDRDGDA